MPTYARRESQALGSLTSCKWDTPVMVHLHSCTNRTDQVFLGVIPNSWLCTVTAAAGSCLHFVPFCQNKRHLQKTNLQQSYTPENPFQSTKGTLLSQSRTIPTMSSETWSVVFHQAPAVFLHTLCSDSDPPPGCKAVTNGFLWILCTHFSRHIHLQIRCKSHLRLALS